ncbi:MAG TPA: helix-turn-helix transcriptional regulator [Baekduia sp.]|nr:helix-turn-helix transcriptional regulator [Baekduia sp.]
MDHDELAACLRTWRDRLSPADVGLPAGGQRRAPGLRREEVAQLAGLSVDYLARLEQGRASNPSPSVLAPLARALRLTDDERAHLFRVAGQAEPAARTINRHLTPGAQRVLDRLADVPVVVIDAAWQVVAANALAVALVGDTSGLPARERNVAWRHFTGGATRFVRDPDEDARMDAEAVADLRESLGRYPDDAQLRALIDDLLEASPRFAEAWERRPVAQRNASRKTVDHPEVGRITLDCDILTVRGSDLRLIVYTAPPGSPDAQALALLSTIGLQSFSA